MRMSEFFSSQVCNLIRNLGIMLDAMSLIYKSQTPMKVSSITGS